MPRKCTCEFPPACNGREVVTCNAKARGDCFCRCGCETECSGCVHCDDPDVDDGCSCDFPDACDGDGYLTCTGCDGDSTCVCGPCGGQGEMPCDGCANCQGRDEQRNDADGD